MPYKNDNLEELFQKAAKDYPLKTDNSDWDKVAANMKTPAIEAVAIRNNKVLKYAAIVVLLLAGSLWLFKSQFNSVHLAQQEKSKTVGGNQTKLNSTGSSSITENNNSKVPAVTNNAGFAPKNPDVATGNYTSKLKADNFIAANAITDGNVKSLNSIDNKSIVITGNTQQDGQTTETSTENKVLTGQNNKDLNTNSIAKNNTSNSTKDVIKYRQPLSKFYGTLYASPQFSMIDFQHLVKPGYQIGIALGYRINNRFDLEIGLQREHINYYTDGKYFDKSGLKLKDGMSLESVNGSSKLTNVPITLKYNFSSRSNGHFYVATGVNALVLTHTESYDYTVSKNGDETDRSKNYSSVTNPEYCTHINVIGGYETKLSNWCNIKIEPYYKIPVGSIGVGKLPVTSFGVNIGIVKDLK